MNQGQEYKLLLRKDIACKSGKQRGSFTEFLSSEGRHSNNDMEEKVDQEGELRPPLKALGFSD